MAMMDRRGLSAEPTAIGLALAAIGCTREPGFTLDDEAGSETIGAESESTSESTSGEDGPNDIPFELVSAGLNATGQFVALRFSEPVGPVTALDPRDFRISHALPTSLCNNEGCVDQTTYWDPNFYVAYYLGGYPPPDPELRFETMLITAGNQATDVFLRFGSPLDPALCQYVDYMGGYESLFVHYSPGEIPLTSADGEALAPIGSQWVEQDSPVASVDGLFPELDPKIAIPCSL
ncbi:hypothetical protein ACNOYE_23905 [Nannocystaceae bacterium ST9]